MNKLKKILIVYENEKFKNQIEYASRILFSAYDAEQFTIPVVNFKYIEDEYDVIIYYGNNYNDNFASIIVMEGKLFGENYLHTASLLTHVEFFKGLPVFFTNHCSKEYLEEKHGEIVYNMDVFQTIFYFLTCYEEFVLNQYDDKGRTHIENSILYKFKLLSRPVVNENIYFFINTLKERLNITIEKKDLWDGKQFSVMLSHDVDIIRKHLSFKKEIRLLLSMILIDRKPKEVFRRINDFISISLFKSKSDPFDTFEYIMNLEKEKNFKSSFYFMADEKTYNLKSSKVKQLFKDIIKNGSEIGFHPGLNTCNNEQNFKKQLELLQNNTLDTKIQGVRQHYLSFNGSKTWAIQQNCGIKYDSTTCFPQQAGFKVGYCLPYNAYDLSNNVALNLVEIPLILMDGCLFDYMNLDYEESIKCIKSLISEVEKYNGVFVILWHNSALTEEYNKHARKVFRWLYSFIEKQSCSAEAGISIYRRFLEKLT